LKIIGHGNPNNNLESSCIYSAYTLRYFDLLPSSGDRTENPSILNVYSITRPAGWSLFFFLNVSVGSN
jgi:hypothetical protein